MKLGKSLQCIACPISYELKQHIISFIDLEIPCNEPNFQILMVMSSPLQHENIWAISLMKYHHDHEVFFTLRDLIIFTIYLLMLSNITWKSRYFCKKYWSFSKLIFKANHWHYLFWYLKGGLTELIYVNLWDCHHLF